MEEIDRKVDLAYRVLDLKPGAAFKDVVEAREDLLTVWDPQRFRHPRLRSKASAKREQIDQAYETVMAHLGVAEGGGMAALSSTGPVSGASLFDEVFAKRRKGSGTAVPTWTWMLALGIGSLVLGYFILKSADKAEEAGSPITPPSVEATSPAGGETATQLQKEDKERPAEDTGRQGTQTEIRPPVRLAPPVQTRDTVPSQPVAVVPAPPPAKPKNPTSVRRPVLARQAAEKAAPNPESESESDQGREAEEAFQYLIANAKTARRLVDNGYPELVFMDWKAVNQKEGELWIDLVCRTPGGQDSHFIWVVKADGTPPVALSEAARSLQATPEK